MASKRMSKSTKSAADWPVADAKARFSEVLAKAAAEGPQVITRNGKRTAVVVSAADWDRRRRGTLFEFLQTAPEGFAELDLERSKDPAREVEL